MKLQNLTIIFIIIILPVVLVLSAYVGYGIKTINKQNMYNTGLISATHDAVFAFELNTKNDVYYNNAENKRSNIKAAIKTFENSLSNTCNLGLYNNEAIEEYIPAIVFGLYDGFYMYSPTQTQDQGYKHELRNFVYYSEEIKEGNIDIIIRYTLDNYVAVSGTIDGKYVTRAGYLVDLNACRDYIYTCPKNVDDKIGEATINDGFTYKNAKIKRKEELTTYTYDNKENKLVVVNATDNGKEIDDSAINYFKESIAFSTWFNKYISSEVSDKYLKIDGDNDPENENSAFVQHKRSIMKEKIEETLNSSITAYANKTRNNYKMPKFAEEDWEKIYNNISVITFVQGMNLGFKGYNNYCILNSTNNQEYVNPNLIYFSDGDNYHDIRCWKIKDIETTGYKIGSFEKVKYEITNSQGEVTDTNYYYKHNELACYECVNGSVNASKSIYEYVRDENTKGEVKTSYFTSLARERYKTTKLLSSYNKLDKIELTLTFAENSNGDIVANMPTDNPMKVYKGEAINLTNLNEPTRTGYRFAGWSENKDSETGTTDFENFSITKNTTLYAIWKKQSIIKFNTNGGSNIDSIYVDKGGIIENIPIPTKNEYEFIGWYYDNSFDKKYERTDIIKEDEITLYAKWKKNSITAKYSYNGKVWEESVTNTGNYTVKDVPDANKSGYILVGWKYEDKTYAKGSLIEYDANNTQELRLVANYIKDFEITIAAKDENGNTIKNYKDKCLEENKDSKETDTNIYTNVSKVIVESTSTTKDPNIQFKIESDNSGNFKEGETEEGWYTVKVIAKVEDIELKSKEQVVVIDRTAPVVKDIILDTSKIPYSIRAQVYENDIGSGIKETKIQYSSLGKYSMSEKNITINGIEYNYYTGVLTLNDAKKRKNICL